MLVAMAHAWKPALRSRRYTCRPKALHGAHREPATATPRRGVIVDAARRWRPGALRVCNAAASGSVRPCSSVRSLAEAAASSPSSCRAAACSSPALRSRRSSRSRLRTAPRRARTASVRCRPTQRAARCAACAAARERAGGALLDRCDSANCTTSTANTAANFRCLRLGCSPTCSPASRATASCPTWQHAMALCFTDGPRSGAGARRGVRRPHLRLCRRRRHDARVARFAAAANDVRAAARRGAAQRLRAHNVARARASCLLPGVASMFNHDCDPSVHVACDTTHEVAFVARDMQAGDELCISYVDTERPSRSGGGRCSSSMGST